MNLSLDVPPVVFLAITVQAEVVTGIPIGLSFDVSMTPVAT
jgi:hypothetical protein